MKIRLAVLAISSLLISSASQLVLATESDTVYSFHAKANKEIKGAVAVQSWVGVMSGNNCQAKEKIYETSSANTKPAAFASIKFELNSAPFQTVADKFTSGTYNCGISEVVNKNDKVLTSRSYQLSTQDGKVFTANPAEHTI